MTINENEQWLLEANCKKCRKQNYCSKPCTRFKRRARIEIAKMIEHKTGIDQIKNAMRNIDENRS